MTQVYAYIGTALQYQLKRVSISAAYNHGVTGGSGVLAGAITDNFTGTVSRQVARTFSVSWNAGYSRNRGIQVVGATTVPNETFDYWFTGRECEPSAGTNDERIPELSITIPEYRRFGLHRAGMCGERDAQSSDLWFRLAQAADSFLGGSKAKSNR